MCTLVTITKQFFMDNEQTVSDRLRDDALSNPHGNSVVFYGTENSVMQSDDIETVIMLLRACNYDRAFVHCRNSTGVQTSLGGCHAFYSAGYKSSELQGWYVMHNGILRSANAYKYRVDSQYLCDMIDTFGITTTVNYSLTEDFANCFFINTYTKSYIVTRSRGGTLFTDKQGNFSSKPCGAISHPVEAQYVEKHFSAPPPVKYKKATTYQCTFSWLNSTVIPNDPDDFVDWVYDNGYDINTVPLNVMSKLNTSQKRALADIVKLGNHEKDSSIWSV